MRPEPARGRPSRAELRGVRSGRRAHSRDVLYGAYERRHRPQLDARAGSRATWG